MLTQIYWIKLRFKLQLLSVGCQSELVEDGLVYSSPGFDKLNLTAFQTDTLLKILPATKKENDIIFGDAKS